MNSHDPIDHAINGPTLEEEAERELNSQAGAPHLKARSHLGRVAVFRHLPHDDR